jgi:hypothetical protein
VLHFGRFGSPTVIRSDKGPHFANILIEQLGSPYIVNEKYENTKTKSRFHEKCEIRSASNFVETRKKRKKTRFCFVFSYFSYFFYDGIRPLLKATGALQNFTLAYSSRENSIVERNNKEINRHLRALTFDKNTVNDYQQLLPFVQRIY